MRLERDVAEVERRLRLYRENCPKRVAEDLRVHPNTISAINLGRHPVQARLSSRALQPVQVKTVREVRPALTVSVSQKE